MMKITKNILLIACCICFFKSYGQPNPPAGYKWEIVFSLTDEFNEEELNTAKWFDYNPTWVGRNPGRFVPEQVSLEGGTLILKNKQIAPTTETVWVHTGFVTSRESNFIHGMYSECKLKAAKDGTVTGFWMSRPGHSEIDVQEAVGWPPNGNNKLSLLQRMNTHYVPNGFENDIDSPKNSPMSHVGDNFQTYGVWWKDVKNITFYNDDNTSNTMQESASVETGGDFDKSMNLRINTETQNWIGAPSTTLLDDDTLNFTSVDYVRTWRLVPENGGTDDISFNTSSSSFAPALSFDVPVTYRGTTTRDIYAVLKSPQGQWLGNGKKTINGLGDEIITVNLSALPAAGTDYLLTLDIREQNGDWKTIIKKESKNVAFSEALLSLDKLNIKQVNAQIYPNPLEDDNCTLSINLTKKTKVQLEVYDPLGRKLSCKNLGLLNSGQNTIPLKASQLNIHNVGLYYIKLKYGVDSEQIIKIISK